MEKSLYSAKHIIYLAIFIFLSINNAHSAHKIHRENASVFEDMYTETGWRIPLNNRFKGNVKTVKENYYTVSPHGRIKIDKNRYNNYFYDPNGNIIEYVEKNESRQINYKYIYEYDSAGNRTKMYCYSHDSLRCILSSIYDERGNEIEYKISNHKGFCLQKTTQKIDENGNVIEIRTFKNDTLQSFSKTSYDSKGNKLTDSTFNQNGVLIKSAEFFYNSVGEVKKMITYNPLENKKDSCFYSYEYDSLGNKTTFQSEIINGELTLTKGIKNNPNGKNLGTWFYHNGEIDQYLHLFKYDSEGRLTDVILPGGEFPRDRLKDRLIYKYDSQGNLVAFYLSYSMGSDYVRKIVYKNNAKGNPRKTKAYYENGKRIKDPDIETTSRYKYEYYKKSEIKK